jgi:hypothetical protein
MFERLLCPSVTNVDLGATFPGANMVQGKNTLGYLLPAHSTHRKIRRVQPWLGFLEKSLRFDFVCLEKSTTI